MNVTTRHCRCNGRGAFGAGGTSRDPDSIVICRCAPANRELDLHGRVAKALGWTAEAARSFSLPALRDIVRPVSSKLALEITVAIHTGGAQ